MISRCQDEPTFKTSRKEEHPHPEQITSQIKRAHTIQALLRTYSVHQNHLSHMQLSSCWISLGQLARQSTERHWLQDHADVMEPLVQDTTWAIKEGKIKARALVDITYAAARTGRVK
eukprot:gnl/MRDRNA2_/MRDRNA2_138599_c0_seq1.p1 gnl/MRDRNA2_/MRDRNA2_138599_c0~~gnl/MRDRNA2_/MRDRNA2_138599_c0_seq1.p1  ORF type:complete len:117 (-),score=17.10 gnl/MRDRNA2_/MRDRNA2_138599_c0_seq1:104-454(-)